MVRRAFDDWGFERVRVERKIEGGVISKSRVNSREVNIAANQRDVTDQWSLLRELALV